MRVLECPASTVAPSVSLRLGDSLRCIPPNENRVEATSLLVVSGTSKIEEWANP